MMDINIINSTIKELEKEDPTFASCQKLASLYIVRDNLQVESNDLVPESTIDDCIQTLLKLFVSYYNNKSVFTLKPLLSTLNQILCELYNTCECSEEQFEIKNFILNINKIVV